MTYKEWMESDPTGLEEKNGIWIIPIEVNQCNLGILTHDGWSIFNFHHFFTPFGKSMIVSGEIECELLYDENAELGYIGSPKSRRLCGSATFDIALYPNNPHWGATLKSLAINNMLKPLGKKFGRDLNKELLMPSDTPPSDSVYETIEEQINSQKDARKK